MNTLPQVGATETKDIASPPVLVLVVGDQPSIRRRIVDYLRENGMGAVPACGAQEMDRLFAQRWPDLVILNLRLGQEDGLGLLRELRLQSDVPVIITACDRRDEIDRVIWLELGADDCMAEAFSLRELLARIRAVLRRCELNRDASRHGHPRGLYRFGDWEPNLRTRRLTDAAGRPVTLTKGEYALLIALLEAPQRPVSREYLLRATRVHEDVFDRSIDAQILRLRRKLEADPKVPKVIRTERGVGYSFALPVKWGMHCPADAHPAAQRAAARPVADGDELNHQALRA